MNRRVLWVAFAVAASAMSQAQWGNNVNDTFLGPEVGVFFPADRSMRDGIGSTWVTYGLGSVGLSDLAGKNKNTSFNLISGSGNGGKVFLASYSYGIVKVFGDLRKAQVIPYFAARAGGAYLDYAVNTSAVTRESAKRIGLNGNAELGVMIGGRVSLSARYDLFPQYDGLRFDGLSLQLKYGISGF